MNAPRTENERLKLLLQKADERAQAYAEVIDAQKLELERLRNPTPPPAPTETVPDGALLYAGTVTIERRHPPTAPAAGLPYIQDPAHPMALAPADLLEKLVRGTLPAGTALHIVVRHTGSGTHPPTTPDGKPLAWRPL